MNRWKWTGNPMLVLLKLTMPKLTWVFKADRSLSSKEHVLQLHFTCRHSPVRMTCELEQEIWTRSYLESSSPEELLT